MSKGYLKRNPPFWTTTPAWGIQTSRDHWILWASEKPLVDEKHPFPSRGMSGSMTHCVGASVLLAMRWGQIYSKELDVRSERGGIREKENEWVCVREREREKTDPIRELMFFCCSSPSRQNSTEREKSIPSRWSLSALSTWCFRN